MRIIDESGKWDLAYDQVALRLDKNRLYAYPLFTNLCDKPIFLKAFVDEKTGKECMMNLRYAFLRGVEIYNIGKAQMEEELRYYESKNKKD